MTPLEEIIASAKSNPQHIVMAEGEDPRIVEGSVRAVKDGLARVTLLGSTDQVAKLLSENGSSPDAVSIVDPATSPLLPEFASTYHDLRKHKGVDEDAARKAMTDPLGFAAMMVRKDEADGTIAGAVCTTGDTVRAAFQIIGKAPGSKMVSSFFMMMFYQDHHPKKGVLFFSDCALIIDPDAEELAGIATASARSFTAMTGKEPKVAMLSFSTKGSARHDRVTKVAEATRIAKELEPDLLIDGELQFDAAFVPSVNARKAPGSPIGADANVFVFPSLEAANIGYKIAERIGGADAIGPVLQGLNKPANDLSRGCDADDVYSLIAVTGVQAANMDKNS